MLTSKPPVYSATDSFVKDLAIVLAEAKRTSTPVWLAAAAHQQFVLVAANGMGEEDDSVVSKLWEGLGVRVALEK
jgi:putative dehydrogenase